MIIQGYIDYTKRLKCYLRLRLLSHQKIYFIIAILEILNKILKFSAYICKYSYVEERLHFLNKLIVKSIALSWKTKIVKLFLK